MPAEASQDFVRFAFRTILGRNPTEPEREITSEFLARPSTPEPAHGIQLVAAKADSSADRRGASSEFPAKVRLVHALLNHNDFVTVR